MTNNEIESLIYEYVKNYVSDDINKLSLSRIKNDLKHVLKQEPNIKVEYTKTRGICEETDKEIIEEKLKSIKFSYIDSNFDINKPKSYTTTIYL